jgi:hypothetical protein
MAALLTKSTTNSPKTSTLLWRLRQYVQLAARAVEVQDGIDDLTHVHCTRAPAGLGGREKQLQEVPLIICQVRQIRFVRCGSHRASLQEKEGLSMTATC